jgi:hypothetical protein
LLRLLRLRLERQGEAGSLRRLWRQREGRSHGFSFSFSFFSLANVLSCESPQSPDCVYIRMYTGSVRPYVRICAHVRTRSCMYTGTLCGYKRVGLMHVCIETLIASNVRYDFGVQMQYLFIYVRAVVLSQLGPTIREFDSCKLFVRIRSNQMAFKSIVSLFRFCKTNSVA